jgi:hypothetical protein
VFPGLFLRPMEPSVNRIIQRIHGQTVSELTQPGPGARRSALERSPSPATSADRRAPSPDTSAERRAASPDTHHD